MPVVGRIFGGADFSSYFLMLGPVPAGYAGSPTDYAALKRAGAPLVGYGAFITQAINFLILAFIIFLLVKLANKLIPGQSKDRKSTRLNLQSLMRISYAVFCLTNTTKPNTQQYP